MNNQGLKITGGIVSLLLVGAVYGNVRRRKRDKVASELLREVSKIVKPTTEGLLSENAFDIHFVDEVLKKVKGKVLTLNKNAASKFADRIHDAWGAWYEGGDDETKVYAVFRELKDKVQVSQVAKAYQEAYAENLIDKLNDRFGDSEVKGKGKDANISGGMEGGVETTKEGQGTTVTEPNWDNPFDMNYEKDVKTWVKPKKIFVLKQSYAEQYAKELKDAYGGGWYSDDDEDAVKAVFSKKLKDKVHVANVSRAFWNKYQKDMWEYLANFLSSSEMEENVHKPVRTLPNYRIAN